eukprot:TRINITY_DN37510_c0_g1_i1.p1 TRINITY_DN37510_c0_g1~~TRINITY_DN37510_c0_g1_i1.p1  ORF type:complete len:244 (+),score=16.72 TRINITY_DN37510_c0_g1_i1:167-898(+)
MAAAAEGRPPSAPAGRPQSVGSVGQSLLGLSHIRRSPRWTFNGRQGNSQNAEGPGPGAYTTPNTDVTSRFKKQPNHAFGTTQRETFDKHRVPGPGAYTDKRGFGNAGQSYSLTPRRPARGKEQKDYPGPGAHDLKSTIGAGPKFTAISRRILDKKDHVPGPGEYEQVDNPVAEKNPSWGFGTASRPDTASRSNHATPGPGDYITASAVGEGPKYSMQARRVGQRPAPSPGPGAHGGQYTVFAN